MQNKPHDGFLSLCAARRSVRRYSDQPVDQSTIERCLEAARLAPSACNSQPWTFIVVDDPALKERVAAAAGGGVLPLNHFARQAPVLIVAVAEPASASARTGAAIKGKPFAMMDVAIAAEHLCLQAADEGLGSCMLGWFDEACVRTLLSIPATARPVLLITLGVADDAPSPRKRKALETISAWNRYPRAEAEAKETGPVQGWRAVMGLLGSLALAFAAAGVGGVATARAGAFYVEMTRPAWAPPGWVFGPVWTLLYALMAVAAWRVWRVRGWAAARVALGLYLTQLAVNALWSWLFFAWRLGAVAFLWILLLCGLVAATIHAFARIDRWAARLLWPYLAWIAFAAALAGTIWRLNPGWL